jgi:YfiR/HmsC-like
MPQSHTMPRRTLLAHASARWSLAFAVLAALSSAAACRAQGVVEGTPDLVGILSGIVHFTRWSEAAAPIRVCVDEHDEEIAAAVVQTLSTAAADGRQGIVVAKPIAGRSVEQLSQCHAVYFGAARPVIYRALLVGLVGKPILTVGQGSDFCSYGGTFCIETSAEGVRIKANLDSIASSGLRVNPQLLRLTQRGKVAK